MSENDVKVPAPLRNLTGGQASVRTTGNNVGELLADLVARHAGLKKHLFTPQGKLRNFVSVYVNDQDIRYLGRDQTPVKPGDVISIVPAIAGGTASAGPAGPRIAPGADDPFRSRPTICTGTAATCSCPRSASRGRSDCDGRRSS